MTFSKNDINYVRTYCYENSVLKTALLNSLSSTFKEGESFFMKSVTSFLKEYPEYRERIISFCKEERVHTEWHMKLNKITDIAYCNNSIENLQDFTGYLLKPLYYLPKEYRLLITEYLEHITYCLCITALQSDEFRKVDGDTRDVFYAHSLEETGDNHSSISRDIYLNKYGNTRKREIFPFIISPALITVIIAYILYLWKTDSNSKLSDFKDVFNMIGINSWLFKSSLRILFTWNKD